MYWRYALRRRKVSTDSKSSKPIMTAAKLCHNSTRCLGGLAPGDATAMRSGRSAGSRRAGLDSRQSRADLDQAQRDKRPECRVCSYDRSCEGVWREYVRQRGWEEFVPVTRI